MSVRFPLVWRTRLVWWLAIGVASAGIAAVFGRTSEITRQTLVQLDTTLFWLNNAAFVSYGGILILVVDAVRRVGALYTARHAAALAGCVATAAAGLLLPVHAFIAAAVPRIAGLESPEELARLVAFHEAARYWHCWRDEEGLRQTAAAHRAALERDFERYGFQIRLAPFGQPNCPGGTSTDYGHSLSLTVPEMPTRPTSIAPFEQRVKNIREAQRYVGNRGGAYRELSLYGTWPIALLTGLAAPTLSMMMLRWAPLIVRRPRLSRGLRWRPRLPAALEIWMTSRLPVLWSSRLFSVVAGLSVGLSIFWFVNVVYPPGPIAWGLLSVGGVALFLVLKAQERTRHHTVPDRAAIAIFLMHAVTALLGMGLAAMVEHGGRLPDTDVIAIASAFGLLLASALQAARYTSTMIAFAGAMVALAGVLGSLLAMSILATSIGMEALGFSALTIGGLAYWVSQGKVPSARRRVALSALLIVSPFTGFPFTLAASNLGPTMVTWSLVAGMASVVAALLLTADTRRELATR